LNKVITVCKVVVNFVFSGLALLVGDIICKPKLLTDNPEASFVGKAKCDGLHAHQCRQFVRLGHVGIFLSQAACFQGGEQRFGAPTVAICGQGCFDPDATCGNKKYNKSGSTGKQEWN
jgi:hypothetical protein